MAQPDLAGGPLKAGIAGLRLGLLLQGNFYRPATTHSSK